MKSRQQDVLLLKLERTDATLQGLEQQLGTNTAYYGVPGSDNVVYYLLRFNACVVFVLNSCSRPL